MPEEHLIEDLRSALAHIPADGYDVWFKVLAALHSVGDKGRRLAHDWSSTCAEKYDRQALDDKWEKLNRCGIGATVRSIFAMAADSGWHNPGFRQVAQHGASIDAFTERALGRRTADAMRENFAAVRVTVRDKTEYVLLHWNGELYEQLELFARRNAIAQYFRRVCSDMEENGVQFTAEIRKLLASKAGSNRQLDTLAEHVMECLYADRATYADATGYPYLPVNNGVLNLISQQLVPAKFRPLSRLRANVVFDPTAEAPRFRRALAQIFDDDKTLIKHVLRLFGYCLLGKPKEHLFVIFHGPEGRNGKSVLVYVVSQIMGGYAHSLTTNFIMVKSHVNDNATPALAKLENCRLAIVPEPNKRHQLDSGFIKQLTGGDQVAARALYGDEKHFEPQFVLLTVTNVIPKLEDDDNALWRRMHIVPFDRSFSEDEVDPDLQEKLLAERSGILNMLLDGVRGYLADGLSAPAKVRRTSVKQRETIDPFKQWCEERIYFVEKRVETSQKELLVNFQRWGVDNAQFRKLTQNEFRERLAALSDHQPIERIERAGMQLKE